MDRNEAMIAARPEWWRRQPDVSIDCSAAGRDRPPVTETVLEAVDQMLPGRTLGFRLDYLPSSLCRILRAKGLDFWAEPIEDGQWRIDVRSSPP